MPNHLLKFLEDKIQGFSIRRITAVSGIYIVDKNGYIGLKINDYFSQNGSPYPGNYAIVAKGPDYSKMGLGQVQFIELGSAEIGGKTYRTVIMPDGKEWMAENLDFIAEGITFRDGTSGNTWTQDSIAQASYYNYDETTYGWSGKKYGLLYSWQASKALTIAGWHVPDKDEWNSLAIACGGTSNAGTKLKSTTEWTSGNGTDIYGFTVYPTAYVFNGQFQQLGTQAIFEALTDAGGSYRYTAGFGTNSSMNITSSYIPKNLGGCYIRLVRDT